MFKTSSLVAIAFAIVATATSVAAQDQNRPDSQTTPPDAKAILKQVAETYKNLKSYHFEGRITTEQVTESMGLKDESKREEMFVSAAIKPGRSRVESKNTNFSVASVSDGKTKWVYAPGANEYTKTEEGTAGPGTGPPRMDPLTFFARAANVVDGFSRVADRVLEAKIIGDEKLDIGGQLVDCQVIEASYSGVSAAPYQSTATTRKLWIDKARNIVLREIQNTKSKLQWGVTINSKMSNIFAVARLGAQVPETLFTFSPPEGAKEVAELNSPFRSISPRRSNLLGKDAIAFAMNDLDGNKVDMQTLKGKVVLLDFWASWCGPCVAEMPHIEKLHKDFKDQGLIVLGVNNEEAEVARAFMKDKGYTFTSLVDEGKEIGMKYEVSGIPQVFIVNREGRIKWHALGYGPGKEVELRAAVEKVPKGEEPPASSESGGLTPIAPASRVIRLSSGVLSGSATKRAQPSYPPQAKEAGAEGAVQVEVLISETGKVVEAKAINGHELLRDGAVEAAKQWEFKPVTVSGAPVKAQGLLTFNFTLQ